MLMKILMKIGYIIFSFIFLFYILLPNPSFPAPLRDSLQSQEPADTETPLRRAYFTDATRVEVLYYYQKSLQKDDFFNFTLPTYRLNYPPEEAQVLIRDQTRSTFLEEIVHPFRGSLFVNGFEPKENKDNIFVGGKKWNQKITLRMVYSNLLARLFLGILAIVVIPIIYNRLSTEFSSFMGEIRSKWKSQ